MAGKTIPDVSQALTSIGADGTATVGSTVGFFPRAYGYLSKAGQPGVTIQVVSILSATTMKVRQVTDPRGNSIDGTPLTLTGGSYSFYGANTYNGGTISLPAQVVMNSSDAPVPAAYPYI
jgi:hypothetical protein